MTSPWDGEGTDPFLPARLAHEVKLVQAEQDVYQSYWAKLSAWLVAVRRAVLSGGKLLPPDPSMIWSKVPAWERAAGDITYGPIRRAMQLAYDAIFGPGYDFDARPSVAAYLAEVFNRMVATPGQVFDMVATAIAAGAGLGEGIPVLTARVETILDATGTNLWPNRAVTVARTETLGALNAGRWDSFQAVNELLGQTEQMEQLWLATEDSRTRRTHKAADQQRVPVGSYFLVGNAELRFPGDSRGPAQEIINCVPENTAVRYGSIRAVTRRWFQGEMITVRFAGDHHLTITPNHPVLRADGLWVPAGEIVEGDYCVRGGVGRHHAGQPDEQGRPTTVGQLYRTASLLQRTERIRLAEPDLHGDGRGGDIEVVPVYGDLTFHGQPATDQQVEEFGLSLARLARTGPGGAAGRPVTVGLPRSEADLFAATGGVRRGSQAAAFLGAEPGHPQEVRLTQGPDREFHLSQPVHDGAPGEAHRAGDGQDAFPGGVALTEVIEVDRHVFRGHVFNLDTGTGWYTANGIAVRNCRCTTLLVRPGEEIDLSDRQLKDW